MASNAVAKIVADMVDKVALILSPLRTVTASITTELASVRPRNVNGGASGLSHGRGEDPLASRELAIEPSPVAFVTRFLEELGPLGLVGISGPAPGHLP